VEQAGKTRSRVNKNSEEIKNTHNKRLKTVGLQKRLQEKKRSSSSIK